MLELILVLTALVILVFLSAFFSASETAHIALSKIKLKHMLTKGVKNANIVHRMLLNLDTLIATILVGNNLVNTAISAIITVIFVYKFGPNWGVVISTFVTTFFLLILCEITPKILASRYSARVALLTAPLMEKIISLFRPLAFFFSGLSRILIKAFGGNLPGHAPLITEEELRLMIEAGKEEGVVTDEERKMLHRILEFGDTEVRDVMVTKENITGINVKASPDDLLNTFTEEGHARIPVYEGSIDKIIGIIYARDLLYVLRDKGLFVLADLAHQPFYVSAGMKVNELLRKFQSDKVQIAVVVDEKKKTLGLVTLEDLVEEIVGEIEEKHVGSRRVK